MCAGDDYLALCLLGVAHLLLTRLSGLSQLPGRPSNKKSTQVTICRDSFGCHLIAEHLAIDLGLSCLAMADELYSWP